MEFGGNKKCPKVLIITPSFSMNESSGITLSNLFSEWQPDKLYLAAPMLGILNESLFKTTLKLTFNKRFKISNKQNAQLVTGKNIQGLVKDYKVAEKSNLRTIVKKELGLKNLINNIVFSASISEQLRIIDPDIVYSVPYNYEIIKFTQRTVKQQKCKLALHFMDDYRSVRNEPGLAFSYWEKKMEKAIAGLINKSSALFSICDEMSREYEKRFNKIFYSVSNPVKTDNSSVNRKTDWKRNNPFRLYYCGNLGEIRGNALVSICKAAEILNSSDSYNIEIVIQSDLTYCQRSAFEKFKHVKIFGFIANTEVISNLHKYDLLVLPNNFDEKSIKFTRLSLSTNVAEYMNSGTPILVHAPEEIALTKYALKNKWAYVSSANNVQALAEDIKKLYLNEDLRKKYASDALEIVKEKHDFNKVTKLFGNVLYNAVEN